MYSPIVVDFLQMHLLTCLFFFQGDSKEEVADASGSITGMPPLTRPPLVKPVKHDISVAPLYVSQCEREIGKSSK